MELSAKQQDVRDKIRKIAEFFNLDPDWLLGIAMTESALGEHQKSPTGARGVFQMTSIAMKDLLQEMEKSNSDLIDIACGAAFLYLLKSRWVSEEDATSHFCDPADRHFYIDRTMKYKSEFKSGVHG